MNAGLFLLAVVGGGVVSSLRFVVDGLVASRVRSTFPWGTLDVNISGSFVLGLLTGLSASSVLDVPWLFVLGGGLMGGYTTFSAPMVATTPSARNTVANPVVCSSQPITVGLMIAARR